MLADMLRTSNTPTRVGGAAGHTDVACCPLCCHLSKHVQGKAVGFSAGHGLLLVLPTSNHESAPGSPSAGPRNRSVQNVSH